MPCSSSKVQWCFGGPYCFHFEGRIIGQESKQQEERSKDSSKRSANVYRTIRRHLPGHSSILYSGSFENFASNKHMWFKRYLFRSYGKQFCQNRISLFRVMFCVLHEIRNISFCLEVRSRVLREEHRRRRQYSLLRHDTIQSGRNWQKLSCILRINFTLLDLGFPSQWLSSVLKN
jgi:hypothetical protein